MNDLGLDDAEVAIVTNAIAFSLFGKDGREVKNIMGVDGIDVTPEEKAVCQAAAERALLQLRLHRPEPLSAEEHEALELSGKFANMMIKIIGNGPSREYDVAEMVAHVHVLQAMILSQAAGRVYPDRYRCLGEVINP